MKVGDLVIKEKGAGRGKVGVVTRVYNRNSAGYVILEVMTEGEIRKWSEGWCEYIGVAKEDDQ